MTNDGPLPQIGAPATQALAAQGITRLADLPHHRAEDLLALHGVGPKAVRLLRAALAEQGMSFADGS
jgi:predicted flap endonuclease-1-like 5' DNA nuclease